MREIPNAAYRKLLAQGWRHDAGRGGWTHPSYPGHSFATEQAHYVQITGQLPQEKPRRRRWATERGRQGA